MSIPTEGSTKAQTYVDQKGWNFRLADGQINIETCPICGNSNWKFFVNKENGLNDCKVCGWEGNLRKLMEHQGDRMDNVQSLKETFSQPDPLPNIDPYHAALMEDLEVLDHLLVERGFTMEIIQQCKLGIIADKFFPATEQRCKALVIPYFNKDHLTYVKYRTLAPAEKDFVGTKGRPNPLFNSDAIQKDMDALFIVEGEADTLIMMSQGIMNVVGVPGANNKKAEWITKLDNCAPKRIYLLYDSDQVGQLAAREIAVRIGIEKCHNIVLPAFLYTFKHACEVCGGRGVLQDVYGAPICGACTRHGKDINEWFAAGHSLEEFYELRDAASPFDVEGVQNLADVINEIERDLNEGHVKPKYDSPWPSLNRKFGGMNPGDVIDIMAEAKVGKTTMAMNWADYMAEAYGETSLIFCLEMPNKQMVRKWISYKTKCDDSTPKTDEETAEKLDRWKAAIPLAKEAGRNLKGDLLFAHVARLRDENQAFELIRQAVRRYGVKFVVFDNLQMLCDNTLRGRLNQRTAHLSSLSKQFKQLAMELGIVIIRIIQPNRPRDGEIVDARNADGSSQIEKDCDAMIVAHRGKRGKVNVKEFETIGILDVEDAFEPNMLARVVLSRYAGGGATTLWMEGGISTVREVDDERRNAAVAPQSVNGVVPSEAATALAEA